MAEETISQKKCAKCAAVKAHDEFSRDKSRPDGRSPYCKACVSAYHKSIRPRKRETNKKWAENNPDKVRAASREWRERHPDYKPDPEKRRSYGRTYYKRHQQRRVHRCRNYRAKAAGAEGVLTFEQWVTIQEFYDYRCLRCYRRAPEIVLSADHVVPTSKGGTNHPDNIQPLCTACNAGKCARDTDYRILYVGRPTLGSPMGAATE